MWQKLKNKVTPDWLMVAFSLFMVGMACLCLMFGSMLRTIAQGR